MEAMTQEQRQKTKEALSRCGQKNWVYGPCNWGWKRAIQLAEEYYREADPGLRGSILQLRYMERRRREEVMDKLLDALREQYDYCGRSPTHRAYMISLTYRALRRRMNTSPETVRVDRTNGAAKPLKWCKVTAAMVH